MTVRMPPVVGRYMAAVNADDWVTVGTSFTADAEIRAVGALVARGPEQIAVHLRQAMGTLAAHHDEPTRVVTAGSLVVVEMLVRERTADGPPVEFDAVDIIELTPDASAIIRLATWYDATVIHGA